MDKSRAVSTAAAAAIALLLAAAPALAAAEALHESQSGPHWKADRDCGERHGHCREGREAYRLKHLKGAAEYFGIKTEGKTAEQLKAELKSAREKDAAKWERFKAEHKTKRLKRLQEKAAKLGISAEGKTAEQLRAEIRAACRGKRDSARPERKSDKESEKEDRTSKKVGHPAGPGGSQA